MYTPVTLQISDDKQYKDDVSFCQTATATYNPSFDGNSVLFGFAKGVGNNAGYAVISPLATAAGGAGGAVSSGADSLNIFGQAKTNVFKNCVYDKTMQDKSALLARPE